MPTLESPPDDTARKPRRRSFRTVLIVLAITVLTAALAAAGTGWWLQSRLGGQIEQLPDAFPVNTDRPEATSGKAMNILLLGSDKRADGSIAGQRSDTIMMVHIAADRKSVGLVSIPRDSWVQVPGYGVNKINAAFSYGGTALAVQTIENVSDVRIDHVAVIDWDGFKGVTDALGGVDITIPKTVVNGYGGQVWEAGTQHMDGETALSYVRQRAGLPGGDFDRIKRQQYFLRQLMHGTLSRETFTSPKRLYGVLDAVTSNLAVDEDWSTSDLRSLAVSLRSLRADDVTFTTVPTNGTGMEGAQSVVYLDRQSGVEMWQAFADGDLADWAREHDAALGSKVD